MKKIFSLLFLTAAILGITTSCSEDRDSNPTLTVPATFVLNTPGLAASNVYDLPNGTVNLTTNQPDYGGWPASVIYVPQVSLTGADDSWTELKSTSTTTQIQVSGDELNTFVLNSYRAANNNNDPEGDVPVWIRLRAYLSNSSNLGEVFSNSVQIKVRAYEPPVELTLPTSIYVCGNSIADAWSTWKFCAPVFGKEGRFYTLIYNNADGFKWGNKANDWFGYSMINEFDNRVEGLEITEDGDGNIVFSKAGWYALEFIATLEGKNLNYKLVVSEGALYAQGAAVDNASWSGQLMTAPASKDGYWTFSDWTGTGELRAYISVDGEDWWRTEFTVVDGGIVWRDADHNCDANWKDDVGPEYSIEVGPGKTLYVNIDNLTGYVE
ncbi:MAG: SusF/SusE family outer membrane protein [Prevotella sp.]|nr:SusF/SusE family outer membrane protein [Prevotella sp.]